ncbi:MAG: response regulator [Acidobacteriota bacterium]
MDKRPKILVVDDSNVLRFALSQVLQSAGYEVLEAATGSECLHLVEQEGPELVLLDVGLPDINGIELCRQIKSNPQLAHTIVIHLSGKFISSENEITGLDAGADGYLLKPIDDRSLLAHVRAIMARVRNTEFRLVEQQSRELSSLEQFARASSTAVVAQLLGVAPLSKSAPEIFAELIERYAQLLELALEERTYKVAHNISEGLRALVDRLGFLRAGPRDVIEIHTMTLQSKIKDAAFLKVQAYLEEGRLMVLELMGYLLVYYRDQSLGKRKEHTSANLRDSASKGELHE